jgi:hypothetical protein
MGHSGLDLLGRLHGREGKAQMSASMVVVRAASLEVQLGELQAEVKRLRAALELQRTVGNEIAAQLKEHTHGNGCWTTVREWDREQENRRTAVRVGWDAVSRFDWGNAVPEESAE